MSYLVSSVCEWSLLVTFIVFFMTLREEAKDFCFSMTITLKDDEEIKRSDDPIEVSKKEEPISTEVREDINENRGQQPS